jgi:hypothetical protein
MTVRELLDRMDSAELSEWMAYNLIEPLPDPWYQNGQLCALMANLWSSKGRLKPDDFIPRARGDRRRQSPAEQLAIFRAIAGAHNAREASRSR